ncbi:MAG: hypothetical protein M1383_01605 [Patescibacteria group bacterium]|nr:hypothetical protein [Patescibacteria group bacterium]
MGGINSKNPRFFGQIPTGDIAGAKTGVLRKVRRRFIVSQKQTFWPITAKNVGDNIPPPLADGLVFYQIVFDFCFYHPPSGGEELTFL